MSELIFRFLVGGALVSAFACLGDLFKPQSFAGLFGAAPSVALATLGLAILRQGRVYAAIQARSMMAGAVAFFIYACIVSGLMMRHRFRALAATAVSLVVWIAAAFGLWFLWLART
jgi:hypothetical protein